VHWSLVREIGVAWLITIPICGALAAFVLLLVRLAT
jgi:phosphate/sulfate permease